MIIIIVHSFYIFYILLSTRPPNIFTRLNLPIDAPIHTIRSALLNHTHIPEHTESLLNRLRFPESRTLYIRYGHDVLHCSYCHNPSDFALYAFPRPLLQYLRTAVIVGLLTLRVSHKQYWRIPAIGLVAAAAVAEAWWLATVPITIDKFAAQNGVVMWHDTLWTIRHIFFLILPPILFFLPRVSPTSTEPLSALPEVVTTLERAIARLNLVKYTYGAVMRVPTLRARSSAWWAKERQEGKWIREDTGVRRVAERLGMGFDQDGEGEKGKLRVEAKKAVKSLMSRFVPM